MRGMRYEGVDCMSQQLWEVAETKISAGPSRVTGPAELIEIPTTFR